MRSALLDALLSPHLLRDLWLVDLIGYYRSMALVNLVTKASPIDAHLNLRTLVSVLTQGPLADGTNRLLSQYGNCQGLSINGSEIGVPIKQVAI